VAAIGVLLLCLVGALLLGVLMDAWFLAAQRTQLQDAASAAAMAARDACRTAAPGLAGRSCVAEAAVRYLQANLAGAQLEDASLAPGNKVQVRARLDSTLPFGRLWGSGQISLTAQATAKF
jgi:hypothetical protein